MLANFRDALSPEEVRSRLWRHATWTTAAKQGIGTAFAPGTGNESSRVWFTLAQGALSEVYYPSIAIANLRMLECAVTDGSTFFHAESLDTLHEVDMPCPAALVYRQTNTAKNGVYTIEKTYVTDPDSDALLMDVRIRVRLGHCGHYRLYLVHHPAVGGMMSGMRLGAVRDGQRVQALAWREDDPVAVALACDATWQVCAVSERMLDDGDGKLPPWLTCPWQDGPLPPGDPEAVVADGAQAHVIELALPSGAREAHFTVAMGFGERAQAAAQTARQALAKGFAQARQEYEEGWAHYLESLAPCPAGDERQYKAALMTVKAHEDKEHPGAVIASLSVPWGHAVSAMHAGTGGYHLIWPRDLYQIASAMVLAGDRAFGRRALGFMMSRLQREDGSFPQNVWPDGREYWGGLQLDQVAFPILLADLVDAGDEAYPMIKRAANFLVLHGPYTDQERWEENPGYSPSTLAAIIAALVVASEFARQRGDFAAAAVYLATADNLAQHVDGWTAATRGPYSPNPYYIRVSDTVDPDDGHWIEIKNGGGRHPKSLVVDAGFLELVRLGIRKADDPLVVNSLDVVDAVLSYEAPEGAGTYWYRYNWDGYGEYPDGRPYDGAGQGHPWPLFCGERGEYEIALARCGTSAGPIRRFAPLAMLAAMAAAAGPGYMIGEQIWDGPAMFDKGLIPGKGTGAATPLVWAMAQYVRLAVAIGCGANRETPPAVYERYIERPPAVGPGVYVVERGAAGQPLAVSSPQVTFTGRTVPGATVALVAHGRHLATQADLQGFFRVQIPLDLAGLNEVSVIGYDNERAVSSQTVAVRYRPPLVFAAVNQNPMSRGSGLFQYPTHPDFKSGDFELRRVVVSVDDVHVYFEIELGHLDDPWGGPTGISKQIIDIYLDCLEPNGQEWTRGLQARFREGARWNKMLRVTGNWHGDAHVYNSDWSYGGPIKIAPQYLDNTVVVAVPLAVLGCPRSGWGIMVVVAGEAGGTARPVKQQADEWTFGGAREGESPPYILDFLLTEAQANEALGLAAGSEFFLPMLRLP